MLFVFSLLCCWYSYQVEGEMEVASCTKVKKYLNDKCHIIFYSRMSDYFVFAETVLEQRSPLSL